MREYGITRMLEHLGRDDRDEQENGIILLVCPNGLMVRLILGFDNAKDTFNIQHVNNLALMAPEFLDDPMVCAPNYFHLLYRITQLLDGRRLVIFRMSSGNGYRMKYSATLSINHENTRKLNGLVIPATQSPDEILKNKISRVVVEVCSTSIYLANPDADYNDYVEGLNDTRRI